MKAQLEMELFFLLCYAVWFEKKKEVFFDNGMVYCNDNVLSTNFNNKFGLLKSCTKLNKHALLGKLK